MQWTRRAWALHCSRLALAAATTTSITRPAQGQVAKAAAPSTVAGKPCVLIVGDSLSAEYGLVRGSGWVALLEKRLAQEKLNWQVVNASISGDTTSGGRSRLPSLLVQHKPKVVVLELGGNDALRGLPLKMTEDNLAEMSRAAKAAGARVLIAGINVPPNYGRSYSDQLTALFGKVARQQGTALVPFILAGVADVPQADELFQADRIHPKAEAQPRMLDNVWPALKPLLR